MIAVSTAGTVFATAAGSTTLLRVTPGADPASTTRAGRRAVARHADDATGAAAADARRMAPATSSSPRSARHRSCSTEPTGRCGSTISATPCRCRRRQPDPRSCSNPGRPPPRCWSPPRRAVRHRADGRRGPDIIAASRHSGGPVATGCLLRTPPGCRRGESMQAVATCGKAAGQLVAPAGSAERHRAGLSPAGRCGGTGLSRHREVWVASDGLPAGEQLVGRPAAGPADDNPDTARTRQGGQQRAAGRPARLHRMCRSVRRRRPTTRFGVRAGRATVLRVLDNDPSVDCTSVVIDNGVPAAARGRLGGDRRRAAAPSRSQCRTHDPAKDRDSAAGIEYEVSNGRGGTASARSPSPSVPPETTNEPKRVRRSVATTEVNGTVSYNVLDDYYSPVGDDLYLQSAVDRFRRCGVVPAGRDHHLPQHRRRGRHRLPVEFVVARRQ